MPCFALTSDCVFPPVHLAEPDGLLAIGGDLSIPRLQEAYRKGIFPWPESDFMLLWYSPDPRFVLYPDKIYISKSMNALLRQQRFEVTVNACFKKVVAKCASITRHGQDGTWITKSLAKSYEALHALGYAHSIEVWQGDNLVGGLYGVVQNKVFCGESMFAEVPNASKIALISLPSLFPNIALIDCQVHTQHLESMGACFIPRTEYLQNL